MLNKPLLSIALFALILTQILLTKGVSAERTEFTSSNEEILLIENSARDLAQIYHASMMYIFGQQALINSYSENKENLFGHLFIAQVKKTFDQIYNRPFPQENIYIQKLLKLMRLVMEDNRTLLTDPQIKYKGFIPAIFAFQLSEKFRERGYGIELKFTNFADRIRNPISSPDKWEQDALTALIQKPNGFVIESSVDYEGYSSTRYMRPVSLTPMCLNCHGIPENNPMNTKLDKTKWSNLDITGFKMEGWKIGELGGGISVVIYERNKSKYDEN